MTLVAIALALTAAVFHGTWNVLVKVSGDPIATFRRATLVAGVLATAVFVPAWLLFGRPALDPAATGFCLLSSALETLYLWLLSTAFRRGELSAVYPIARGSAPLLSVTVGLVVLGSGWRHNSWRASACFSPASWGSPCRRRVGARRFPPCSPAWPSPRIRRSTGSVCGSCHRGSTAGFCSR